MSELKQWGFTLDKGLYISPHISYDSIHHLDHMCIDFASSWSNSAYVHDVLELFPDYEILDLVNFDRLEYGEVPAPKSSKVKTIRIRAFHRNPCEDVFKTALKIADCLNSEVKVSNLPIDDDQVSETVSIDSQHMVCSHGVTSLIGGLDDNTTQFDDYETMLAKYQDEPTIRELTVNFFDEVILGQVPGR